MAQSITDLKGKRALLQLHHWLHHDVEEYTLIETSPSGDYVRLRDGEGDKIWVRTSQVNVVEVLAQNDT